MKSLLCHCLRAERWYAVPKGAEAAGLGRFRGWTGLLPEGYGLLTQAGCIEGLRKKGS